MRFLSVCSGIEAASCAWGPLGWKAVAFSEIEPFPCAVLAHHHPDTPNWGDMTKFEEWPDVSIDLLCGGTPCQSFSVAGLRAGLDDPRGNLMLTFGAIAAKYRPQWLVWENVPGVLSSNGGSDFGSFLGMLGQLGYGFAYRVLDAQYFGVAQRRRRVFVVGCLGDWRSAAAVLFERHSMQGHPAPRRQAGQRPTGTLSARTEGGGGLGTDFECSGGVVPVGTLCVATGQAGAEIGADMAPTLNCNHEAPYAVYQTAHTLRGEGFDASEDGTGRGAPLVPIYTPEVAATMVARSSRGGGQTNSPGHQADQEVIAYRTAGDGAVFEEGDVTAPLTTGTDPCANIMAFDTTQVTSVANRSNPQAGDPCHPLAAGAHAPAVAIGAFKGGQGSSAGGIGYDEHVAPTLSSADSGSNRTPTLMHGMAVRRLTPMECERLQSFPDGYTNIPHRKKQAADGPRYKALGNSWCVNNVRWIGERIQAVALINSAKAATNLIAEVEPS